MRNKVAKMYRGVARIYWSARSPKETGYVQNSDGVVTHKPGSYKAIYKGLKDSYKRARRYGDA